VVSELPQTRWSKSKLTTVLAGGVDTTVVGVATVTV